MSKEFEGKTVIITGAATGIGKAAALQFAAKGANVVIGDVDSRAADTVREINDDGGSAIFVVTDVSDEQAVKNLIQQAIDTYGGFQFAFNNAGVLNTPAPFKDIEVSEYDKVMDIDVRGVFLCMKYQLQHMVERGEGSIVNTASVAGIIADPQMAPYIAAKHAVIGLSKSAGFDHGKDGVRVNAVAPGLTETPMTQIWKDDPAKWAEVTGNVPLGIAAKPDDVASMVVFLCSDAARFCNMQTFTVDGGQTAH